jgi:voltage-gated potassium channel
MDSLRENRRQIQIALAALGLIVTIGVFGFILIENLSLLDAIWLTIITLTTIGYGDIYAHSPAGRIFTLLMILFGLGSVAYGLQATAAFFLSPGIREVRQRRRIQRYIDTLRDHYIICGAGEMVNKTINLLIDGARRRQAAQREAIYRPVDAFLDRIFGDDDLGHFPRIRGLLRRIFLLFVRMLHRADTLLDVVVVVTPNAAFANRLREQDVLVIEGDPTNDDVLRRSGIQHAHAMMVMLDNDTESLLAVLSARNLNASLDITAATLEESLAKKMVRAGANGVIAPFDISSQFLNNATLRPAVNEFFQGIFFDERTSLRTVQLELWDDSPWIGRPLGGLKLRERFQAGVIGLRQDSGIYLHPPADDYVLKENEILITVAPGQCVEALIRDCRAGTVTKPRPLAWQRLPLAVQPQIASADVYTFASAEDAIRSLSNHFIICGSGRVARNAISKLDPARPFVIISEDEVHALHLLERGFRVVYGPPTAEETLRAAGVERAQAIMVAVEDDASSVLTVINCRAISKRLLITATAMHDEIIPKLKLAGADRVVSPFNVAALFMLLASTRPAVSDFMQHVVYNYVARIETTELYMQEDSPWIGRSIDTLRLAQEYNAGVIGVRHGRNESYLYAPHRDYVLQPHDVLIVVTPMDYSDELRTLAHGSSTRRPVSLRRGYTDKIQQ